MSRGPKPCMDCGVRVKALPSHRCVWCNLRKKPVHIQAEAAKRRLAMVPEAARMKRSQKVIIDSTPPGTSFCAGCQSYMPTNHFGKSATQCRGCMNAKAHEKSLESNYGIDKPEFERLMALQDGRCAICGRRPTGERRLAVDHDHKTGLVRGLLCSGERGCNKGLLGSAHDDVRMLWNAYAYLIGPPATLARKDWWSYLDAIPPAALVSSSRYSGELFVKPNQVKPEAGEACDKAHFLPVGSVSVPNKRGVWQVWVSDDESGDQPF